MLQSSTTMILQSQNEKESRRIQGANLGKMNATSLTNQHMITTGNDNQGQKQGKLTEYGSDTTKMFIDEPKNISEKDLTSDSNTNEESNYQQQEKQRTRRNHHPQEERCTQKQLTDNLDNKQVTTDITLTCAVRTAEEKTTFYTLVLEETVRLINQCGNTHSTITTKCGNIK